MKGHNFTNLKFWNIAGGYAGGHCIIFDTFKACLKSS